MLDKTPLKSKKFIAYLIADLGWKIIILYMLMHLQSKLQPSELTFLLTVVITSGVIQIGYILGQAALDKYINAAVDILDKDQEKK
jgi:hypothetical protein